MKKIKYMEGHWRTREDGRAAFRNSYGNEVAYDWHALEEAIKTVKSQREVYFTQEAFDAAIAHYTTGLSYTT